MARVLKPGGKLLLTEPFIQPLHELPSDYFPFTPSSLRVFAESAGLEVESITPRGNFASANGAMLSQWLTRSVGASKRQSDGSVILSPWRSVLLLPLTALIQIVSYRASKLSNDQAVCQGYALVAERSLDLDSASAETREKRLCGVKLPGKKPLTNQTETMTSAKDQS